MLAAWGLLACRIVVLALCLCLSVLFLFPLRLCELRLALLISLALLLFRAPRIVLLVVFRRRRVGPPRFRRCCQRPAVFRLCLRLVVRWPLLPSAVPSLWCALFLPSAPPPFSVDYLRGVAPRNGCSIAHVLRFLPSSSSHSSSCKVLLRRQVAVGDLGLLNVAVIPSVRHFANESGYGSVVAVTLARFRSPSSVSRSHLGSINLCPTQIIWLSCVGAASRWESKRSSLLPGPLLPRRTVPVSIVFYSDGSSTVSEALPIQDGLVTGVEDGLIIGGGSNIAGQRECGGGVCVWLAAVQESSVSRSASVSIDKVLGGNGKCSSKSHLSCSGLGCVPLRAGII